MFRTPLKFALLFSLALPILGALCYRDAAAHPVTNLQGFRKAPAPEPEKGSPGPVGSAKSRTFNSTLPLLVHGLTEGEAPKMIGMTGMPGGKPLTIPARTLWYVQPVSMGGGFGVLGGGLGGGFAGGVGIIGGANIGFQAGGQLGGGLGRPFNKGMAIGNRPNLGKGPKMPAVQFGTELTGKPLGSLIAEMKKSNVPGLSLGNLSISDDDLARLAAVPSLQILVLDSAKVGDSAVAKLATFRSLRMLSLQGSGVTDEGLKAVKGIKSLGRLHLAGKAITNKGLGNLREATGLTWLRLDNVGVDGDGLASLASLSHLETLELCGGFLDSELKVLEKLSRLRTIRLHKTGLTDDTLALLSKCKSLRSITIDGHWGLEGIYPAFMLKDGKVEWNLANAGLMGGFGGFGGFAIPGGGVGGAGGFGIIGAPAKPNPPQFTAKGIAKLAELPNLQELNIAHDKLTDDDLAFLPKFTSLKRLGVFAPLVTDKGLEGLKSFTKLETIDLRGTQATTATARILRSAAALRLVKSNLVSLDPKYKTQLAGWKKDLPRATIRPLLDMGSGFSGFGGVGLRIGGGVGGRVGGGTGIKKP